MYIDTHTHLFLDAFNEDRDETVQRAIDSGVTKMLLPHIDSETTESLLSLCKQYPDNCIPMMGLHPTHVKDNYKEELEHVKNWFTKEKFCAVGEIGIDLYWDKTRLQQQQIVFREQISMAKEMGLPIVIHSRNSFDEIFEILDDVNDDSLTGVFHSFAGTTAQAEKAIGMGFYVGINGIVTFKNSDLKHVVEKIDLKHILLETDSPFLAPTPKRGKRNESLYLINIAKTIAEIHSVSIGKIATQTSENAVKLFNL